MENTEKSTIRLSVPIDKEINDEFSDMMPKGIKAEVVRCLVQLVIKTQKDLGTDRYLIDHLIREECKLVIIK